jgi:hypothetical protein
MSSFVFEALKRYLVLQLIESTSMQSSTNTMSEINKNALQTAETMKGISMNLFGSNSTPPPQPQTPIVDPFAQQQPQQQGFTNPFEQRQQGYTNEQVVALVTDMQKQLVEIQKQTFDGLHAIYNALKEITLSAQNTQAQNTNSPIDNVPLG